MQMSMLRECLILDRRHLNVIWGDVVRRRGPLGTDQRQKLEYYAEVLYTVPSSILQVIYHLFHFLNDVLYLTLTY